MSTPIAADLEQSAIRNRVPTMSIDRFLRRPEVQQATGLPKPTMYRQISEGTFPKPEHIGKRAVAWRESDIVRWQNGERDWQRAA